MTTLKVLRGPNGLHVVLDASEVFPDDPGNGTPAIVRWHNCTATYWCACSEGELQGPGDVRILTPAECKWLASIEDDVDAFMQAAEAAWDAKHGNK